MITLCSATFVEILIGTALSSGILFGCGFWFLMLFIAMITKDFSFNVVNGAADSIAFGIVFGLYIGAWFGWRMRRSHVEIPITDDEDRLRKVIGKACAVEKYLVSSNGDSLLVHKKTYPFQLIQWVAKMRYQKNAVTIEGPKLYVRDLEKIIEIMNVVGESDAPDTSSSPSRLG